MKEKIEFKDMLVQMSARQLCEAGYWMDNLLQGNKVEAMRGVYLDRIHLIRERLDLIRIKLI